MKMRNIIGLILIVIGLSALFGLNIGRLIFPLVLITFGVILLRGKRTPFGGSQSSSEEDVVNDVQIFSDANRVLESKNFSGGKVISIFSDSDIDLSKVKTKRKEIKMELVAVFSDLNIRIPEGWTVQSEAVGILGEVKDRTHKKKQNSVKLLIDGASIFGSIEVRS